MGKYVVGVDLGGTNIRAGVVNPDGSLLSFVKCPTSPDKEVETVISQTCETIRLSISESHQSIDDIAGISIGACGLVDRNTGHFVSSSVMPKWHNVPLAKTVSQSLGIPVMLENDAQAAIWGEWWIGVAKGAPIVVGMTLGTGIGGGVILNGNIFYGANGNAGEFGHMTVDPHGSTCFCGNRGCLGLLASATGLVQRYAKLLEEKSVPLLPYDKDHLTAEMIYEYALSGNESAYQAILQTGEYLAIGTVNLLNCFNPNIVVFTGGLTGMGKLLLEAIRQEVQHHVYSPIVKVAQIEFGKLGDTTGVIGSAGIFFKRMYKMK